MFARIARYHEHAARHDPAAQPVPVLGAGVDPPRGRAPGAQFRGRSPRGASCATRPGTPRLARRSWTTRRRRRARTDPPRGRRNPGSRTGIRARRSRSAAASTDRASSRSIRAPATGGPPRRARSTGDPRGRPRRRGRSGRTPRSVRARWSTSRPRSASRRRLRPGANSTASPALPASRAARAAASRSALGRSGISSRSGSIACSATGIGKVGATGGRTPKNRNSTRAIRSTVSATNAAMAHFAAAASQSRSGWQPKSGGGRLLLGSAVERVTGRPSCVFVAAGRDGRAPGARRPEARAGVGRQIDQQAAIRAGVRGRRRRPRGRTGRRDRRGSDWDPRRAPWRPRRSTGEPGSPQAHLEVPALHAGCARRRTASNARIAQSGLDARRPSRIQGVANPSIADGIARFAWKTYETTACPPASTTAAHHARAPTGRARPRPAPPAAPDESRHERRRPRRGATRSRSAHSGRNTRNSSEIPSTPQLATDATSAPAPMARDPNQEGQARARRSDAISPRLTDSSNRRRPPSSVNGGLDQRSEREGEQRARPVPGRGPGHETTQDPSTATARRTTTGAAGATTRGSA